MRTFDESMALIDRIIGRCHRSASFAEAVLTDPEKALVEYGLQEGELDDFRAIKEKHHEEASRGWAEVRANLPELLRLP
jgi:hypothetical protein